MCTCTLSDWYCVLLYILLFTSLVMHHYFTVTYIMCIFWSCGIISLYFPIHELCSAYNFSHNSFMFSVGTVLPDVVAPAISGILFCKLNFPWHLYCGTHCFFVFKILILLMVSLFWHRECSSWFRHYFCRRFVLLVVFEIMNTVVIC